MRRTPAGSIAVWAGKPGEAAVRAAKRNLAEEIHIHVFGEGGADTLRTLLNRRTRPPIRWRSRRRSPPMPWQQDAASRLRRTCGGVAQA